MFRCMSIFGAQIRGIAPMEAARFIAKLTVRLIRRGFRRVKK